MLKKIIIVGFFDEAIELCEKAGYEIVGIVDKQRDDNMPYPYIGDDAYVIANRDIYSSIPLFLVPDEPEIREKLFFTYHDNGFTFETVVSPNAIVSKSAVIGEGCMIQDGCNISSNVKLGRCVRVNSCANIMHDSCVGDFTTIAPSSVILGRCNIGNKVYIGANATVLPDIQIRGGIVGAGAVVVKNIDDRMTVVGVPAKNLIKEP